jgi:hypothetical protein
VSTSCSTSQSIAVGTSATVKVSCHFAPGTTITVTFNGATYATETASGTGSFTENFAATDPHIALNGGPQAATSYGTTNTFVATGLNVAGGGNVATTLITVPAPATASTATSGLAFTGTDIIALVISSLALIALGFLVLTFSRRWRPVSQLRRTT